MIRLFYNFFIPLNSSREEEILYCFKKNLENEFINEWVVFGTEKDISSAQKLTNSLGKKIHYITHEELPTYEYIFALMDGSTEEDINITLNADCYMEADHLPLLERLGPDDAWCLSRWDIIDKNFTAVHRNTDCSQDCWIIKGPPKNLSNINFGLGQVGCDNRFAYELHAAGYSLRNPSKSFKTYHYHFTDKGQWINENNFLRSGRWWNNRVHGPYIMLWPTTIEDYNQTKLDLQTQHA